MSQVLVLNGPNLNLLGSREPAKYGTATLSDMQKSLEAAASRAREQSGAAVDVSFFQSNSEGALIDRVQAAAADGVGVTIINPGGYSHTSVALRDAFLGVQMPLIEVHVSNIYARESFRHHSYFSDIAIGSLAGFGVAGYEMAFDAALRFLKQK